MMDIIAVNQVAYNVIRLLGHGKGGYSYLVEKDGCQYVLKQIHHEPCDYYSFGNKIEAEINDYNRLLQTGIRLPRMLDVDIENERIVKEYIDGPTIYELVKADIMDDLYITQVREMAQMVYSTGLNIDYFPTNFVVQNGVIFYIDYECNTYMDEWNFENWVLNIGPKQKNSSNIRKIIKMKCIVVVIAVSSYFKPIIFDRVDFIQEYIELFITE